MSRIFTTTLRLNLDNEEDRRAWEHLQSRDRKQYRSYSSSVVAAVNAHFSRQERLAADPFLETRERQDAFLQEVKNTIRETLQASGTGCYRQFVMSENRRPILSERRANVSE